MKTHEEALLAVAELPLIPSAEGAPVFGAPWQAEAFAMTISLHARGIFTWKDWAERLAARIAAAQDAGDTDRGDTYYDHWLTTLEGVVVEKGLLEQPAMAARYAAWDRAARSTPHGEPIVLGRDMR